MMGGKKKVIFLKWKQNRLKAYKKPTKTLLLLWSLLKQRETVSAVAMESLYFETEISNWYQCHLDGTLHEK